MTNESVMYHFNSDFATEVCPRDLNPCLGSHFADFESAEKEFREISLYASHRMIEILPPYSNETVKAFLSILKVGEPEYNKSFRASVIDERRALSLFLVENGYLDCPISLWIDYVDGKPTREYYKKAQWLNGDSLHDGVNPQVSLTSKGLEIFELLKEQEAISKAKVRLDFEINSAIERTLPLRADH